MIINYNYLIVGIGIWGEMITEIHYAKTFTYLGKHVIVIDGERYELSEGCYWEIQIAE